MLENRLVFVFRLVMNKENSLIITRGVWKRLIYP